MHGILGERDKTIMSSGLLYEVSGGAAVGGMPGCPAKPTDLVSRGALIWGAFCFLEAVSIFCMTGYSLGIALRA